MTAMVKRCGEFQRIADELARTSVDAYGKGQFEEFSIRLGLLNSVLETEDLLKCRVRRKK